MRRPVAVLLVCALLAGNGIATPAGAAYLDTAAVLHETPPADRAALARRLAGYGVEPALAERRVAALTEAQVHELNGRLDELPAGGSLLGLAAFVFVVLVITDALGFTDVFTFVKKVGR